MSLFIACLLIYNFDMNGWWYVVAVILWLSHVAFERSLLKGAKRTWFTGDKS